MTEYWLYKNEKGSYWSFSDGWGTKPNAWAFTEEEKPLLFNLPENGEWVKCPEDFPMWTMARDYEDKHVRRFWTGHRWHKKYLAKLYTTREKAEMVGLADNVIWVRFNQLRANHSTTNYIKKRKNAVTAFFRITYGNEVYGFFTASNHWEIGQAMKEAMEYYSFYAVSYRNFDAPGLYTLATKGEIPTRNIVSKWHELPLVYVGMTQEEFENREELV